MISLAREFSPFPAGRYQNDGEFNGTRFREEVLAPALKAGGVVEVSFDGVAGFGSSFLEEAFGGLLRNEKFEPSYVQDHLTITTTDDDLQDFRRLAEKYLAAR